MVCIWYLSTKRTYCIVTQTYKHTQGLTGGKVFTPSWPTASKENSIFIGTSSVLSLSAQTTGAIVIGFAPIATHMGKVCLGLACNCCFTKS